MQLQSYSSNSIKATLVVLEQEQIQNYDLSLRDRWSLGRATDKSTPDISLKSKIAGRQHGEFFYVEDQLFYSDRGSVNGTFYNGKKISPGLSGRSNPIMINDGDILRIDYDDLSVPDVRGVWMLFVAGEIQGQWTYYSLVGKSEIIIGNDCELCDIILPRSYISSQQTKIILQGGNYFVSDCDSIKGTWLNGEKLTRTTKLQNKDYIVICDCLFLFTGNGFIYNDRVAFSNCHGLGNMP